ncbi:hypothetical protein KCN56_01720 [Photobacterium galatheae]|uniref:hypothetical protein n=1 Tax=Photobacterium galatheae TaxID=1654360 RepID=UPI00202CB3D7|nr:hypothetical protein [Photobacterium galatheae]MCM0147288.1 hypothetical protein [Photobacterium galatheae]
MNEKILNLGIISEDFDESDCMFREIDERSYLYSTNAYIPCSSFSPIAWEDSDLSDTDEVPDIVEKGDKVVTKEVAQLIMSYDPYGVEVYPAKLVLGNDVLQERYILSIKNIIDVIDHERSRIIKNPKPHRPPIVSRLAICPEKLERIPRHKRLVFRVKDSNTIFFDGSIVERFVEDLMNGHHHLCQAIPFNTSELAPV